MNLEDYPKLIDGLKKINKADPSVEVYAQENGDIILATCGEVHLERCLNDLDDLTKVKIEISEPLVPFKETITFSNVNVEMAALLKKVEKDKEKKLKREEEVDEPEKKEMGEDAEVVEVMKEIQQEEEEYKKFWSIKDNNYKKEQQEYQDKQEVKKIDKKNKNKFLSKLNKVRLCINL